MKTKRHYTTGLRDAVTWETAAELSVKRYGVDLLTHWPEAARHRAARHREQRRQNVEWRIWRTHLDAHLALNRQVSDAFARLANRLG